MKNLLHLIIYVVVFVALPHSYVSAQSRKPPLASRSSPCSELYDENQGNKSQKDAAIQNFKKSAQNLANEQRRTSSLKGQLHTARHNAKNLKIRAENAESQVKGKEAVIISLNKQLTEQERKLGIANREITKRKDTIIALNALMRDLSQKIIVIRDSAVSVQTRVNSSMRNLMSLNSRLFVTPVHQNSSDYSVILRGGINPPLNERASTNGPFKKLNALKIACEWTVPLEFKEFRTIARILCKVMVFKRNSPNDSAVFVTSGKMTLKKEEPQTDFMNYRMEEQVLKLDANLKDGESYIYAVVPDELIKSKEPITSFERLWETGKVILSTDSKYYYSRDFELFPKMIDNHEVVIQREAILTAADEVTLELTDSQEEDDDIVQLLYNGKSYGPNNGYITLSKKTTSIKINLSNKENSLIVIAISEGKNADTKASAGFEIKAKSNGREVIIQDILQVKGHACGIRLVNTNHSSLVKSN